MPPQTKELRLSIYCLSKACCYIFDNSLNTWKVMRSEKIKGGFFNKLIICHDVTVISIINYSSMVDITYFRLRSKILLYRSQILKKKDYKVIYFSSPKNILIE